MIEVPDPLCVTHGGLCVPEGTRTWIAKAVPCEAETSLRGPSARSYRSLHQRGPSGSLRQGVPPRAVRSPRRASRRQWQGPGAKPLEYWAAQCRDFRRRLARPSRRVEGRARFAPITVGFRLLVARSDRGPVTYRSLYERNRQLHLAQAGKAGRSGGRSATEAVITGRGGADFAVFWTWASTRAGCWRRCGGGSRFAWHSLRRACPRRICARCTRS